jgi:hypothetical protein
MGEQGAGSKNSVFGAADILSNPLILEEFPLIGPVKSLKFKMEPAGLNVLTPIKFQSNILAAVKGPNVPSVVIDPAMDTPSVRFGALSNSETA